MREKNRCSLVIYIDILKVLTNPGPSSIKSLMLTCNLNSKELTQYLDFLVSQSIVEKSTSCNEEDVFVIKQQGVNVLRYFKEL
jgi:predicted transcriptional regulator